MRIVAKIIIRSDPDIVNMVEVKNLAVPYTFNEKLLSKQGYKAYLTTSSDTFTNGISATQGSVAGNTLSEKRR